MARLWGFRSARYLGDRPSPPRHRLGCGECGDSSVAKQHIVTFTTPQWPSDSAEFPWWSPVVQRYAKMSLWNALECHCASVVNSQLLLPFSSSYRCYVMLWQFIKYLPKMTFINTHQIFIKTYPHWLGSGSWTFDHLSLAAATSLPLVERPVRFAGAALPATQGQPRPSQSRLASSDVPAGKKGTSTSCMLRHEGLP